MSKNNSISKSSQHFVLPLLLAFAFSLSACAPTAHRPDPQLDLAITQAEKSQDPIRLANALWAKAATQEAAEAAELQLRAIETLIDSANVPNQTTALNFMHDPRAQPTLWHAYFPRRATLLQAFELTQRKQYAEATRLLNNLPAPLEASEAARRLELLAQISAAENQPLQAARLRIALDALLPEPRRLANQEALLGQLSLLNTRALEQARHDSTDDTLNGWLDLSQAQRKGIKALDQWRLSHANVPLLPALFEQLKRDVAADKYANAAHLALLLPDDAALAEASRAVLAGVTRAHDEAGDNALEIREYPYNTQSKNFLPQLKAAAQDGALAAIGPLDRPSLQSIATLKPPIPLIALNTLESGNTSPSLIQFGLPPEDEAVAIAARMISQGQRRILILAPTDTLGERMVKAFSQQLIADGGQVVAVERYGTAAGLASDWGSRVQQLLQPQPNPINGKPVMREDADALFLVARAQDGRQLLPLLRAQGAGDLAIYASSHIYEGVPKPEADRVLDGVVFSEMPLMLNFARHPGQSEPSRFENAVLSGQPRLFALGFDAYQLAEQLNPPKNPVELHGQTGQLKLGKDGLIQRAPSWGGFRGGLANPVGTPANVP
jgi:hypothetical protein